MNASPPEQVPAADTLLSEVDGLCAFDTLAIQLQIHANDSLERKTLSQHFDMPAQLTVMLLLEGDVRVTINRTSSQLSARNGPVGFVWLLKEPGTLVRHIRAGQRVRKVNVTVPLHSTGCIELPPDLQAHICLDGPRVDVARWTPTPHAMRCAQEILLQRGQPGSSMHSLEAYIAGLSLLQQALRMTHDSLGRPPASETLCLSDRDMDRARRIRERILQSQGKNTPTALQLARELGMSVSTLQRLFKAAYGTSVMDFQRSERLRTARTLLLEDGMTVGEVSYRCGYSTVSNFSSAFQRTFGYPPSACMRR